MFGYATRETKALMPMPIQIAHQLARQLAEVRKAGVVPYLGPDGKTQVSVRYENDRPVEIAKVLISTQHREDAGKQMIRNDLWEHVLEPVLHTEYKELFTEKELLENFMVNPTGKFVIGGPVGDAGLTGRKIIVDTYGGAARHGGGAFSGKDPSKVDRSAAYAARYVAKNVVAAGLAERCELQVAYAIGVAHPVSVMVQTFGTGKLADSQIAQLVQENFDLRPAAFRKYLDLHRPIFQKTAAYGHFGREDADFTWEWARRPKPRLDARVLRRRSRGATRLVRLGLALEAAEDRRRLLYVLDDLLGLRDAGEDEVRFVGASRGELDVADLHDPLVDTLVVVHVLHPLQPRLLDLPRDDPDLDVEAAVGDRVDGRDPLDESDHDRDREDRDEDEDPEAGAAVDEPREDTGGRSDECALDVEADDRPPGRMSLVDHPLPGLQVHGGQPNAPPGVREPA
jgi:hypothetical protein